MIIFLASLLTLFILPAKLSLFILLGITFYAINELLDFLSENYVSLVFDPNDNLLILKLSVANLPAKLRADIFNIREIKNPQQETESSS